MPDFLAKANPNTILLSVILLLFGGTEVVPKMLGTSTGDKVDEVAQIVVGQESDDAIELRRKLQEYERREHDEALKAEIRAEFREGLADAINTSIRPLIETIAQISRDMELGKRWSIEDMAAYHEAEGKVHPDEIQSRRLAEDHREFLKRD